MKSMLITLWWWRLRKVRMRRDLLCEGTIWLVFACFQMSASQTNGQASCLKSVAGVVRRAGWYCAKLNFPQTRQMGCLDLNPHFPPASCVTGANYLTSCASFVKWVLLLKGVAGDNVSVPATSPSIPLTFPGHPSSGFSVFLLPPAC